MWPAGEQILDRDPRGVSRGNGDLDLLLRLDSLVDPVFPGTALGGPACKLVDDQDLAVADDILPIAGVELSRLAGPLDGVIDLEQTG